MLRPAGVEAWIRSLKSSPSGRSRLALARLRASPTSSASRVIGMRSRILGHLWGSTCCRPAGIAGHALADLGRLAADLPIIVVRVRTHGLASSRGELLAWRSPLVR